MKKLLFACMCAATFGAFADPLNSVGFEGIPAGTGGLGEKTDAGKDTESSGYYFMYEAATNGSTDSSVVKAYGGEDNLPAFTYPAYPGVPDFFQDDTANKNYLELSTEGGTLWRSATETWTDDGVRFLGDGITMQGDNATIYVDTMVQFTPTEDGEIPAVTDEDKLAIWLNVDSSNEESPVTNLCVYAKRIVGDFSDYADTKFTVNNFNAQPGVWYRLTVKAIDDVLGGMDFPGFMVYIDGKLLTTDTPTADPDVVDANDEFMTAGAENMKNGSVFISLVGGESEPYFRGVGFKGSGAIDNFQIDTAAPGFLTAVGTLDFTLTWGEGISAVSYTIGEDTVAATSGTKIDVAPNTAVNVQVTYAPWYVAGDDTAGTSFTVSQAGQTYNYTAKLADTPAAAGAGTAFGDLSTATVKAWAEAKNITPAQIAECAYALDAFLLNTGLDAAPALTITSVEETDGGWNITVKATAGDATVSLDGINGALKVKTAATLGALADATADTYTATFDADGVATIKVTGDNKNFMKATVVAQ